MTALELLMKRLAARALNKRERLQSLLVFGNGRAHAQFVYEAIHFGSFAEIEDFTNYPAGQFQGLNGEGI